MINQPIEITDLQSLHYEKQRLLIYSSYQEELLKDKICFLKSNYLQIIGDEFLPFTAEKNKKVNSLLDWMNEFVVDKLLKINFNGKSQLPGTLLKVIEVVIIRLFNNFVKK